MTPDIRSEASIARTLNRLPENMFLLTAAHGVARNGILVSRVQHASNTPPTVVISVTKGQPLTPLIRDSRSFALCELGQGELFLSSRFNINPEVNGEDPFLGLSITETPSGLPVPMSVDSWLECELIRHLDIEADHELYVGRVVYGGTHQHPKSSPEKSKRPGTDGRTSPPKQRLPKVKKRSDSHLSLK